MNQFDFSDLNKLLDSKQLSSSYFPKCLNVLRSNHCTLSSLFQVFFKLTVVVLVVEHSQAHNRELKKSKEFYTCTVNNHLTNFSDENI